MEVDPKCLFKDEELQKKYVSAICDNSEMPWLHFSPSVLWQKSILILMKDMMEAYESEAGPLRMVARLAELWSLLYENTRLLRQGKEEDPEKIIMQNMIGYIQHHYQDPVTLADIAEAGHVSTSKCCQMFAGYDQISPIQYLLEYRLSQSAFLLRNTDARITDVALSSGFNDANYFTRCFHKWAGMTPSAYRKAAA
jgi:AraC-like DNA-binding protein